MSSDDGFCEVADRFKEFANFYTIPRGSDGALINGSYNRVWKIESVCGALSVCKTPVIGYERNGKIYARPLTVTEAERLQTLPDEYTKREGVSDAARLKTLGNGWTVNVIAHLLSKA